MAKFRITTKQRVTNNGVRIEPGMTVELVTTSPSNPLLDNSGQLVVDAFMRVYGIDLRKAGVLSMAYLNVDKI